MRAQMPEPVIPPILPPIIDPPPNDDLPPSREHDPDEPDAPIPLRMTGIFSYNRK